MNKYIFKNCKFPTQMYCHFLHLCSGGIQVLLISYRYQTSYSIIKAINWEGPLTLTTVNGIAIYKPCYIGV